MSTPDANFDYGSEWCFTVELVHIQDGAELKESKLVGKREVPVQYSCGKGGKESGLNKRLINMRREYGCLAHEGILRKECLSPCT